MQSKRTVLRAGNIEPGRGGRLQGSHTPRIPIYWRYCIVLFALWGGGVATSYTLGGLLHLLLVCALVVALVQVPCCNRPL